MANNQTLIRVCVFLVLLVIVLGILVWNVHLNKKTYIDHETYRTIVIESVKDCIKADTIEDPLETINEIQCAQTKLRTAAQLVGGMNALQELSGMNVTHIDNTMTYQAGQVRTFADQKGLLKPHPLVNLIKEPLLQK